MKNNIFDFATSELSQDAMLCWSMNWINDSTSNLYPLALELLSQIGIDEKSCSKGIQIKKQLFNLDIILFVNGQNKVVIIEDKTNTSEHHDQIERYRKRIIELSKENNNQFGINEWVDIQVVYIKTGFFNDKDRQVKADYILTKEVLISVYEKYVNDHPLVYDFYVFLKTLKASELKAACYVEMSEGSHWNWSIAKSTVSQYTFLRDIFPESMWDQKSKLYEVRHGFNPNGRPWSQVTVLEELNHKSIGMYTIFWRVDTNHDGPYIALRMYHLYNKGDADATQAHKEVVQYHKNQLLGQIGEFIEVGVFQEAMDFKKADGYYESTLISFNLKRLLPVWDTYFNEFKDLILKLTNSVRVTK